MPVGAGGLATRLWTLLLYVLLLRQTYAALKYTVYGSDEEDRDRSEIEPLVSDEDERQYPSAAKAICEKHAVLFLAIKKKNEHFVGFAREISRSVRSDATRASARGHLSHARSAAYSAMG